MLSFSSLVVTVLCYGMQCRKPEVCCFVFFFKFVFKSSYIVCDMNGYVTGEKLSRKLSLRNRLEKYMQANKERNSDPVSLLALLIYFTLYIYMYIFNQTGLINPVNLNLEYGLACRSSPASSH